MSHLLEVSFLLHLLVVISFQTEQRNRKQVEVSLHHLSKAIFGMNLLVHSED